MNYDNKVEIFLGAILIVIYAWERFNTPSTNRSSTTASRYYTTAIIYILIYLATFYIFTLYPELLKHIPIGSELIGNSLIDPSNSTLVFVAMLLSLLVPKVPLISLIDTKLLEFLHHLADIPYKAIRLSKELQQANYQIPASMRTAIIDELVEHEFNPNEIDFSMGESHIQKWLNITALKLELNNWEKEKRFAAYVLDRSDQYEHIKERYKRLNIMIHDAFALKCRANEQPELEALQDAVNKFHANLINEEKTILSEICDFISHGILDSCISNGTRNNTLKTMGFGNIISNREIGLYVINRTIIQFGLLFVLGNYSA